MFARIACVAVASWLLLAGVGCRDEGPAEELGRQIDEAVEETQESAEELKKKMTEE